MLDAARRRLMFDFAAAAHVCRHYAARGCFMLLDADDADADFRHAFLRVLSQHMVRQYPRHTHETIYATPLFARRYF